MPEILSNIATQNLFVPQLTLGPVKNCKQISFVGIGQPFLVQLWKPDPHDANGNPVIEGITRAYPANGGDAFQGVSGVAFASALPNLPAQIYADLAYQTDPLSLGQSITSAVINNSGQLVVSGVALTGSVAPNGAILAGTGYTVTYNGTGDYTVNFNSAFAAAPIVVCQCVYNGGAVIFVGELDRVALLTSFRFQTYSVATQVAADSGFQFLVVEVQ